MIILVPINAADRIRAGGTNGTLTLKVSSPHNAAAIVAVGSEAVIMPTKLPAGHFLWHADSHPSGYWFRASAHLHAIWFALRRRIGTEMPTEAFKDQVAGFKHVGAATAYVAITFAPDVAELYPDAPVPEFAAWQVTGDGVSPVDINVQSPTDGLQQLRQHWPVDKLANASVLVVGAGSIGGAAAQALAGYGLGVLRLLDPDRLRWHNVVRHVGRTRDVGHLKVTALAAALREHRPGTVVEEFPLDVTGNADLVRPVLAQTDVVLCTADGVAPRRVVSHLARRAGIDAVVACVLENGALGEVLRLRPWPDRGCLTCQRHALVAAGGLDPEPGLDAGYGTGTRHRPMTAVGGDLHLVGQLAAKVAIASILERRGQDDQMLPGEHAVIGLRPQPDWAPPFDVAGCGEIRWLGAFPPRAGCPTCEDP